MPRFTNRNFINFQNTQTTYRFCCVFGYVRATPPIMSKLFTRNYKKFVNFTQTESSFENVKRGGGGMGALGALYILATDYG